MLSPFSERCADYQSATTTRRLFAASVVACVPTVVSHVTAVPVLSQSYQVPEVTSWAWMVEPATGAEFNVKATWSMLAGLAFSY